MSGAILAGCLAAGNVDDSTACDRITLPFEPSAVAWVGERLAVASGAQRNVVLVDLSTCRTVGTPILLPKRAPVVPTGTEPGWVWGPDSPGPLAGDRSQLWVAGEFSLYRYDPATGELTRTIRLFRRERHHGERRRVPVGFLGMTLADHALWAANLAEGPTFVYRFDGRTARPTIEMAADTEIVGMTTGAGRVWAISHDRGTLLEITPATGGLRRIPLDGEPHGVAFGAGFVWVALYHERKLVRIDPRTGRRVGNAIDVPFPPEPMAASSELLWGIPSTGGSLADGSLHTVVAIEPITGRVVVASTTQGRPEALAAREGGAWIATSGPNELVHFTR